MARFESHSIFELPDDGTIIWRYMGFSKFVSLLKSSALYFTVANKFDDPWEGTLPLKNKENLTPTMVSFFENARSHAAVNCWHKRVHESSTMWKNYTTSNEGIAIKSNIGRLKSCFVETEASLTSDASVFIGQVKYLDYDQERLESNNSFVPLLRLSN